MKMNKNAYNINVLDKVHQLYGDTTKIKKLMLQRIKDLKNNGFYIDICLPHFETLEKKSYVEILEDYIKQNNKDIPDNFDISKYYSTVGIYTSYDNNYHEFIHVSPKNFTFEYVDFENAHNVLNISQSCIYLNSFWGIYVKNDLLEMHDLIQYDFFKKYYRIVPYNMYDGGNDILNYSDNRNTHNFSITGTHNGAIFYSWEDFILTTENTDKYQIEQGDSYIKELELKLKETKKNHKLFIKESEKKLNLLKQIKFANSMPS
jgi:hypothetical protein